MFEKLFQVLIIFFVFTAIGLLICKLGKESKAKDRRKFQNYTCGEAFPEIRVGSSNFYQTLKDIFRLEKLRNCHSGNISDYLIWILIGLIMILIIIRWV